MAGTLARVSALLTSVGAAAVWPPGLARTEPGGGDGVGADVVAAVAEGRGATGEGLAAVDHLEQRGLLAVEVFRRAFEEDHPAVGPARLGDLVERQVEASYLGLE